MGVGERGRGRRVEEGQVGRVGAPQGQLQGQAGEVDRLDLGRGERPAGGRARPRTTAGGPRPARSAPPGRRAGRPTPGSWGRCAAGSGRCGRRSAGLRTWPLSTTMRTPSTVRLVSAMSVASTTRRRPGGDGARARSCSARSSRAEQRPHVDVGWQRASPGQSPTRRMSAAPARKTSTSPVSEPRAWRTTAATASCGAVARVRRAPPHLDRVRAPVTRHHRRRLAVAAEQRGDPAGVEGGRHGQDPQVGAQHRPGVEGERQSQVGLEVAFVDLVEDHQADPGQRRVVLEATGEDPLGDDLDAGGAADPAFVAGAVADGATDLLAEQARHPVGRRPGGEATGLEHDDAVVPEPRLVEEPERDDGRLPRPGRGMEHRVPALGERHPHIVDAPLDGQVGQRWDEGHRCSLAAPPTTIRGGVPGSADGRHSPVPAADVTQVVTWSRRSPSVRAACMLSNWASSLAR